MSFDPEEGQSSGPVIRDKRRIDPVTGEVRERHDSAPGVSQDEMTEEQQTVTSDATSAEAELAERTADLQRLQAEYVNYKRRVDRDKDNARKNAVASTLGSLLPVLDDIARAREHGEVTGGFKAVADSFERTVEKLGLVPFGEEGDEFDPRIHEALMHSYSDDVTGPTCQAILQVGYRIDDRVLRPARVAVTEPTVSISGPPASTTSDAPVEGIFAENEESGPGGSEGPDPSDPEDTGESGPPSHH